VLFKNNHLGSIISSLIFTTFKDNSMNIWLTGDLHFNKKQFEYLLKNENKYDILCLAGDLLNHKLGSFKTQTTWISDFLQKFEKPILLCSGNHDIDKDNEFNWLDNCNKTNLYLDNRKPKINNIRFGVMPYMSAEYSRV
jgi:predicted phosphodiesterase